MVQLARGRTRNANATALGLFAPATHREPKNGPLAYAARATTPATLSVISVSTLMTRETSQIARKAVETIATIQKATMVHEESRTTRPRRVLTDERG
jgi:hypothetical protein